MRDSIKVYVKSYGCQMNVYDSGRMSDMFVANGAVLVDNYMDADIVILNTCCIREKAEDKLFSDLGRIRPYKQRAEAAGKQYIICVTGCIAQLRKDEIYKRCDDVDIILGPQMVQHVLDCVMKKMRSPDGDVTVLTTFNSSEKFDQFTKQTYCAGRGASAFVTIQEGCNNFCTYCVVPHTRGREVSRPMPDVIQEIRTLVSTGVREIVLLGQNVNSYHGGDGRGSLADLIRKIAEDIPGVKRLRYTTSHPKDVTDDLLLAHKEVKILMPFLHLPVQSGADRILQAMNRHYSSQEYLECIDRLREARPDIAFSSDFIVGFPGESEQDFMQTLELVKKVKYAQAYSFKYSPRPNTKAAVMDQQIPESEKEARLDVLQNLLNEQQNSFNDAFVGRTVGVMFEKTGRHPGQLVGKTEYSQAVSVMNSDNKYKIGDIAQVEITENLSHSLSGIVVDVL